MQVYEMKTLSLTFAFSTCPGGAQEPPAAGFAIRHASVDVAAGDELNDQTFTAKAVKRSAKLRARPTSKNRDVGTRV